MTKHTTLKPNPFHSLDSSQKAGWHLSFLEGFSQDEDGNALPWMTYPAIEFLKKNLNSEHKIFEFGCGASTLFFAPRVKKVISLETNPIWFRIINEKLRQQNIQNVKIFLMNDGLENSAYENFPADLNEKFDLIVIDSLKRHKCSLASIKALADGGRIILDDSERKNYQKIFDFFAEQNFVQKDFPGIAPGQLRMKNTSFFGKVF
jgi:predicted O-methyltransferase YrrM